MPLRTVVALVTAVLCVWLPGVAGAAPSSPVADAARDGDVARVRTLLQAGADVNAAHRRRHVGAALGGRPR